jgi:hypothetical protein
VQPAGEEEYNEAVGDAGARVSIKAREILREEIFQATNSVRVIAHA